MLKGIGITIGIFFLGIIGWALVGGISGTVSESNKPDYDVYEIEQEIHNLTNLARSGHTIHDDGTQTFNFQTRAPTLSYDPKLAEIARLHSQDMINRNYFDHTSPNGKGPTERGLDVGYRCYKEFGTYYTEGLAENLFQTYLYDSYTTLNGVRSSYDWNTNSEIASSTVQGWLESYGHRENIMDKDYDKEGIGVVIAPNDQVYITQLFC